MTQEENDAVRILWSENDTERMMQRGNNAERMVQRENAQGENDAEGMI